MNLYVLLNDENRIVMVTVQKQNDEQFEFTFPADFDVTDIINWKIVDGELVHDEIPTPEPEPSESLEEKVAALEEQNDELQDYIDIIMTEVIPSLMGMDD